MTEDKITICAECEHAVFSGPRWGGNRCGAIVRPPGRDLVTGGWGYLVTDGKSGSYVSDEQYDMHPLCRDTNGGACERYEEMKS